MGAVISDHFDAGTLDPAWTEVDSRADSTMTLEGSGEDTYYQIDVPAGGATREAWTGGNDAPRIMQTIDDEDLYVEAKFNTEFDCGSGEAQINGLIFEENVSNYTRFSFYQYGTLRYAHLAEIVSDTGQNKYSSSSIYSTGSAPYSLRAKRVGNLWTMEWACTGHAWSTLGSFTSTLTTVSKMGYWAGNAGSTRPAFTSTCDYVFNINSPAKALSYRYYRQMEA